MTTGSTSFLRESFVEGLLQKSVPQSKVAVLFRLNVLCWCTSEECEHSITSTIVTTAILAAKSILQIVYLQH